MLHFISECPIDIILSMHGCHSKKKKKQITDFISMAIFYWYGFPHIIKNDGIHYYFSLKKSVHISIFTSLLPPVLWLIQSSPEGRINGQSVMPVHTFSKSIEGATFFMFWWLYPWVDSLMMLSVTIVVVTCFFIELLFSSLGFINISETATWPQQCNAGNSSTEDFTDNTQNIYR